MKRFSATTILFSILLLFFIQGFAQIPIKKSTTTKTINDQNFIVHKVEKGQTLYSIAKAYNVTIKDIAEHNRGVLNSIPEGANILIPQSSPNTQYDYHLVKKGETLYSISRRYNTTPGELLKLNPGLTTELKVGQKVNYRQKKVAAPSKKYSPDKIIVGGKKYTVHKVEKGQTLYSIARDYNIPVEVIADVNDLSDGAINTDQKLLIPYGNIEYREKKYYYHEIMKGETLYSIARHYKTDITKVVHDNPFTKGKLKQGMVIKIEITRFNKNTKEQSHDPNIIFHEVQKGESAFSIANHYMVDLKKIKRENSAYDIHNLREGVILKIPSSKKTVTEYTVDNTIVIEEKDSMAVKRRCDCDSISSDTTRTINIALMLPFFITANDTMEANKKILKNREKLYPKSIPFIEFYEGVLVALDTLKKYGYNIHLTTYDTELDTFEVKKAFLNINKANTDIIIGPVYHKTFYTAARFAKQKGIPIVSPLAANTCCTDNNEFIIAANTPNKYRITASSLYFSQFVDQNFVLIHNGHIREFDMMENYKQALCTSVEDSIYFNNIAFKEIYFAETGIEGIEDALSNSAQNIIIIPSNDQGYVSDIVTRLFQYNKKYDIQLYGLSKWETFDNIELKYMYELNLHFPTSNFIDYDNYLITSFVENFRQRFSTEPSKFTFQGYDLTMYFTNAISKYPERLQLCLPEIKSEGLQMRYDFRQENGNGGMVNRGVYLMHYSDNYTRERVFFQQEQIEKEIAQKVEEMKKFKSLDQTQPDSSRALFFNAKE